ncbi:MAG: class I cytochrome c, partial [Acidobacteria bacterium]
MTPALTGGAFMANWDGLTVGDLFDRIRISMPADRPG